MLMQIRNRFRFINRRPLIGTLILVFLAVSGQLVYAWTNGQAATLVLGQPNFTTSIGGTSATLMAGLWGIAVDPTTGKVFVADTNNDRVLRFASRSSLSNGSAAEAVLGQPDFTTNTYPSAATSTSMVPESIAVDSSGRLWVCDSFNRVLRFDHAATKANDAAADGVLGQADFTHDDWNTTQSTVHGPEGLAVDNSGRLWVADSGNHRVLRFDNAAAKANGANADGVLGQIGFTQSSNATTQNGFYLPTGLGVDSLGHLWVADTDNNRVLRFDNAAAKTNGANADSVLGQADFTHRTAATSQAGMNGPSHPVVDSTGRLWVPDTSNSRVLRFENAAAKAIGASADGVLGQPNFTSSAATTTQTGMSYPLGVAVDSSNNLWVADQGNNRALYFANSTPPSARIDTIGIFRTGTFYLRLHNSTGNADLTVAFTAGTKPYPVVGDWTGAGFDTVGIFDQSNGLFTLCTANVTATCANVANRKSLVLGVPNDMPLAGRWLISATNAGVGVFRPTNGLIYLKNALTTGFADYTMVLGIPGDVGVAGDWNGKGFDSPGAYRPSNSTFYLSNQVINGSVTGDYQITYGLGGDAPVVGDWIAQGHDGVGLFRQSNGFTYLKNALTTGYADNSFTYGIAGDVPVAGHWQITYPPIASAPILITRTPAPSADGGSVEGSNPIGD